MLILHETHSVRGSREADFDAAYREGWMGRLASGNDARLLYFLRHRNLKAALVAFLFADR